MKRRLKWKVRWVGRKGGSIDAPTSTFEADSNYVTNPNTNSEKDALVDRVHQPDTVLHCSLLYSSRHNSGSVHTSSASHTFTPTTGQEDDVNVFLPTIRNSYAVEHRLGRRRRRLLLLLLLLLLVPFLIISTASSLFDRSP